MTVESGYDRLDVTFQGIERKVNHMLAALIKIRVRKFEERRENIEVFDTLRRQVTMRIEFAGNQNIRPDNGAHALQKITLAIVIALGDHGAMQAENDCIDGHCRLELIENFIAQFLESLSLQQTARFCPGGSAFDDGQPFRCRTLAQCDNGRRAKRGRFRMLARRGIEGHFERGSIGWNRRKRIGFCRKRCGENAHGNTLCGK